MRLYVPWREDVAVVDDGLWLILSNPPVVKHPCWPEVEQRHQSVPSALILNL